jgi:type II secretory pathway component PulF
MAIATTVKKVAQAKRPQSASWTKLMRQDITLLRGGKVTNREIIFFTNQLALMLEIGTPLNESLAVIQGQVKNPPFRLIVATLLEEVEGGKSLSEALQRHPRTFSPEYISLVSAGESSGQVHQMLNRVMQLQERREAFATALKGSLTYPAVLCLVSVVVVIFMLVFVFPRFETLFSGIEDILPPTTKFLMAVSHYLKEFWYVPLAITGLAWAGLVQLLKTEQGKLAVDKIKTTLPLLAGLYVKIYLSQFMRTLGFLLGSSVPLLDALRITRRGTANLVFLGFIDRIVSNVETGNGVSPAFAETSFVPETVSQMVKVGEESQSVDRVLLRLSDYYEGEIGSDIKKVTTIIEPALLILMGIVVGVIVISLILPIFKLSRVVK